LIVTENKPVNKNKQTAEENNRLFKHKTSSAPYLVQFLLKKLSNLPCLGLEFKI
jgi:hypothetical protein